MGIEDKYENLKIYCAGLEATLGQRKARIEQLEAEFNEVRKLERSQVKDSIAYKQGWKDCANQMQSFAMGTARSLRQFNDKAFRLYLEVENNETI
jgi:uncharacterized protein involved in exopolysaccharide biosynthesis